MIHSWLTIDLWTIHALFHFFKFQEQQRIKREAYEKQRRKRETRREAKQVMRETTRWNNFFRRYQKSHLKSYNKELLGCMLETLNAERKGSKDEQCDTEAGSGTTETQSHAEIAMAIDYMSLVLQPRLNSCSKRMSVNSPSHSPPKRSWAYTVLASVDSVLEKDLKLKRAADSSSNKSSLLDLSASIPLSEGSEENVPGSSFMDVHKAFAKFLVDFLDREKTRSRAQGASSLDVDSSYSLQEEARALEISFSNELFARARSEWLNLEENEIEAYKIWSFAAAKERSSIMPPPKSARALFMIDREQDFQQPKVEKEDTHAPAIPTRITEPNIADGDEKSDVSRATLNSITSSHCKPPSVELPDSSTEVGFSLKDGDKSLTDSLAQEWSAASHEVRSKYVQRSREEKRRFLEKAENIAFENFSALTIKSRSPNFVSSTSSARDVAMRSWSGLNAVARALHFHAGVERLLAARRKVASINGLH